MRAKLFSALLALAACLVAGAPARGSDAVQAIIDEYGKETVVTVLLERCGGQLTVRTREGLTATWGRPRLDLVDAATLDADARACGLEPAALRAAVDAHVQAERRRERRLSPGYPVPNAAVPLANIDPDYRVRPYRGRSWTVRKLMDDAERERDDWPGDLNRLRQEQAAVRNRRIEDILTAWQARYGSMDVNAIARAIRERLREPRRVCRELRRDRKRRDEYDLRGCRDVEREYSRQHATQLRRELAQPFHDFERVMKPQVDAWTQRRRASGLY